MAVREQAPIYDNPSAAHSAFVYFPLGFTNESKFKGDLLIQVHASLVRGKASLDNSSILTRESLMKKSDLDKIARLFDLQYAPPLDGNDIQSLDRPHRLRQNLDCLRAREPGLQAGNFRSLLPLTPPTGAATHWPWRWQLPAPYGTVG
uniref:Uncharacterized protein n=1 Tax=Candidatus Kentrum sp. SD TaxID=2126332 RepID=A0A451BQ75_9GAMM|nr:MAG: hypothetical protein BECKSD772D_GA0070982_11171 [Candidatus Kentron sp. SD]